MYILFIHVHIYLHSGGYYTVFTTHGLRIVALNTNLYYTSNKATQNSKDPGDQLLWLNKTLEKAEVAKEKVGSCDCMTVFFFTYE